ncbi:uncharacterized protein LAESUDRAFT_719626 [Laetiporus sulphureus 93-53]|uniref:Uncharacterized protein n=1 Tax=Laetiporus sulphureus 93-53 TaxID=1314785 RepID=A0A165IMA8_9APHY|nr:uncharacterized protein LAESUDRAFT_719626 [Laetiporus sulphureus 93-53]KZT13276.1 hypothetical protein LAESUDRAFT_719626 [Laetiporus sulphureus 93-53]
MNRSAHLLPHELLARPATAVGQCGLQPVSPIIRAKYTFIPFLLTQARLTSFSSPDIQKASPSVLPLLPP